MSRGGGEAIPSLAAIPSDKTLSEKSRLAAPAGGATLLFVRQVMFEQVLPDAGAALSPWVSTSSGFASERQHASPTRRRTLPRIFEEPTDLRVDLLAAEGIIPGSERLRDSRSAVYALSAARGVRA